MVFILIIIGIVATPFLLFIGFSGGFKRNPTSSATFKYDDNTCVLKVHRWFMDNTKQDEHKQYKRLLGTWYTLPDMKKCSKKESISLEKHYKL